MSLGAAFSHFARLAATVSGKPASFILAVAVIVGWAASGKFFDWSDTWQLVINTGTTIITFLMVFLIQHTQNSDTKAMHLKIDEVIRALPRARNDLRGIEKMPADEMDGAE